MIPISRGYLEHIVSPENQSSNEMKFGAGDNVWIETQLYSGPGQILYSYNEGRRFQPYVIKLPIEIEVKDSDIWSGKSFLRNHDLFSIDEDEIKYRT